MQSVETQDFASLLDFKKALSPTPNTHTVIAEVKKASPSAGTISTDFDYVDIAKEYESGGGKCYKRTDR